MTKFNTMLALITLSIIVVLAVFSYDVDNTSYDYIIGGTEVVQVPNEKYVIAEEPMSDIKYDYMLYFTNASGVNSYLYFTPDSSSIGRYYGEATYYICGNIVSIDNGKCYVDLDGTQVVTTDFCLESLK